MADDPDRLMTQLVPTSEGPQTRQLQALPPRQSVETPPALLQQALFARLPQSEKRRTHFGRSLDLNRIESTIRSANIGRMRPMADLSREAIMLDGHASSVLNKRLNRVAALPWSVEVATGGNVDKDKALDYQKNVEEMLQQLPRFKQSLKDAAWGVFDGRAALEIQWQFVGGDWPWRPASLNWIHPRRISFGPQRDLRIIDTNRDTSDFADIGFPMSEMPYKFIQYRPRLFSDYPEREGLAPRILYWSFFQRFGVRERMILLELFGKPWRIISQEKEIANTENLQQAFDHIEALGATTTARLPMGMSVEVVQPQRAAGAIHAEAIEHAQLIISKLVLGGTSTTDAQAGALGSNQADVHKTEEDLIVEGDGEAEAEAFEDDLTDAIVALNRGPLELVHAPHFRIKPQTDPDPKVELANAQMAAGMGVPVAIEDLRERTGYRPVEAGEPVLVQVHPQAPLGGIAPPPRVEIVYPIGKAPGPGETRAQPEAALNIPAGGEPGALPPGGAVPPALPGAPPQPLPGGEPGGELPPGEVPPSLSDSATLAEKMTELGVARCEHGFINRCRICGIERVRDFELGDDGAPVWAVQWKAIAAAAHPEPPPPAEPEPAQPGLLPRPQPAPPIAARALPADPVARRILVAHRLNRDRAKACQHGRGRKCGECGIVRSRPAQPWRAVKLDGTGTITLPFAGFQTFDACLVEMRKQGNDEEASKAICGALQAEGEPTQAGDHLPRVDADGAPIHNQEGVDTRGGKHRHPIAGGTDATETDADTGAHSHAFLVDDVVVLTNIDGDHGHTIEAGLVVEGGEHEHQVQIADPATPGASSLHQTGAAVSTHGHNINVANPLATLIDGQHVHTLELLDGREIVSLLPGQLEQVGIDLDALDPDLLGRLEKMGLVKRTEA